MKEITFEAIGTHWHIEIYDQVDLKTIEKNIIDCCREFESNYSRFKETSLLSKLNKEKTFLNPSSEFLELLELGSKAKEITDGRFDIAVGTVLENLGYDSKYSFTSKESIVEKEVNVNSEQVTISQNTRIDLGGIGKGFLIDKIANLIKDYDIKYFFINAGGDIYSTSNFDKPIEFSLENPFVLDEAIGTIEIKDKALASSSSNRRSWKDIKTGKKFNHLIDMNKGENVENVAGIFVEGLNATNADIASTCLFISPIDAYRKIADFYNIEFLAVFTDKSYIKSNNYSGKLFTN
ncbi:MAG: FAD:protein FMN transferase [Candidatus Dojkabacteria bacterium]